MEDLSPDENLGSNNTIELVLSILDGLSSVVLPVVLFGGWAEELHGLRSPSPHKDIDLLLLAENFDEFDVWLSQSGHEECKPKHFSHKRAYFVRGVLVKLLLIMNVGGVYVTNFWGEYAYEWPQGFWESRELATGKTFKVASSEALAQYRASFYTIDKVRKAQNTQ